MLGSSRSLDIFIRESMTVDPPTREEEKALAIRIMAGDDSARDELAVRNMRLAMHLAKKYRGHGVDLDDLVNEAGMAVFESISSFRHEKGFRFSSWASWYIKNALKALLCTNGHAVTLPKKNCNHTEARNVIGRMSEKLGRLPTGKEFKAECGMQGDIVQVLSTLYQPPVAIDLPIRGDCNGRTLADKMVADIPDTDEPACLMSDKRLIEKMMAKLSPKERDIITRRFGLNDTDPEVLDAIGADHGITRERTRQIQNEAVAKMATAHRIMEPGSLFNIA